jgi:glycosyltransferase involved in cell wall biosynthesis
LKVKPDVVVIGYPPIFSAVVLYIYSRWYKIPYILDIKDQWPDIFARGGRNNLFKFIYVKLLKLAFRIILNNAYKIVTISYGFKKWLRDIYSVDPKFIEVIFLTRPALNPKSNFKIPNDISQTYTLIFAGSLTSVFNFDFLSKVKDMKDVNIEIYGQGPELTDIKLKFGKFNNVFFGGFVTSEFLAQRFSIAHGILAPYRDLDDFNSSIPNKIFDAIDIELPILTSLNGDVRELIIQYEIGEIFTLDNSNFREVLNIFIENIKNGKYNKGYEKLKMNTIFDHDYNYNKFNNILNEVGDGK